MAEALRNKKRPLGVQGTNAQTQKGSKKARNKKRPVDAQEPSAKKQKVNKKLSDDYFGIFLVGECGDGKTALVQYMTDKITRNSGALLSAPAHGGVTKNVSYVNVRPELMKNAVIVDIPGIGDYDIPIPELISGIVQQMEAGCPVHAIVLMSAMSKERSGIGARAAGQFVRQGFVKSLNNVIYCGSMRDVYVAKTVNKEDFDLTNPQEKEQYQQEVDECVREWRKLCADPVTKKWFRDKHAATVTIQLKMKRQEKGKAARVVDPDSEDTDVSELIGLLRNLQREKIEKANWQTPDLRELYTSISDTFGYEPPDEEAIKKLEEKIEKDRQMMEQERERNKKMVAQLLDNAKRDRENFEKARRQDREYFEKSRNRDRENFAKARKQDRENFDRARAKDQKLAQENFERARKQDREDFERARVQDRENNDRIVGQLNKSVEAAERAAREAQERADKLAKRPPQVIRVPAKRRGGCCIS